MSPSLEKYEEKINDEWNLIHADSKRPKLNPKTGGCESSVAELSLLSMDELWYHFSATAKMHAELKQPIPDDIRSWARREIDLAETLQALNPETFYKIPLLKLVCCYGIQFGVHGQLEMFYLATRHITHDNVCLIAKRMCVVLSMRDYIDRHWNELIIDGITQEGPRIRRGDYAVGCAFSSLGNRANGVQSSSVFADLYPPSAEEEREFLDIYPFKSYIDIQTHFPERDAERPSSPETPSTSSSEESVEIPSYGISDYYATP